MKKIILLFTLAIIGCGSSGPSSSGDTPKNTVSGENTIIDFSTLRSGTSDENPAPQDLVITTEEDFTALLDILGTTTYHTPDFEESMAFASIIGAVSDIDGAEEVVVDLITVEDDLLRVSVVTKTPGLHCAITGTRDAYTIVEMARYDSDVSVLHRGCPVTCDEQFGTPTFESESRCDNLTLALRCEETGGAWNACGSGCGPRTCASPEPDDGENSCTESCVETCACPDDKPRWDAQLGCIRCE